MTAPDRPHRAHCITILVEADTWDEACRCARQALAEVNAPSAEREVVNVSVGTGSSYSSVLAYHDPTMTPERHRAELDAYLGTRDAQNANGGSDG